MFAHVAKPVKESLVLKGNLGLFIVLAVIAIDYHSIVFARFIAEI